MKLKHAILGVLGRDDLKRICGDLELGDVDLRSVEAMGAKLSRAHRAAPAVLFEYLSEAQVKAVADLVGAPTTGRKQALIQALLVWEESVGERGDALELPTDPVSTGGRAAPAAEAGRARSGRPTVTVERTEQYRHSQEAVQRPDVGVQDQFQGRKPPKAYRFDSSLDPALSWDESRERELGEWLIGLIERAASEGEKAVFSTPQVWMGGGVEVQSIAGAAALLKNLSKPFLNWAGKAERPEIRVPTMPLFVHERHSTKAILEGIRERKAKGMSLDLFGDAQLDIRDKLEAYEHKGPWQNRMILGDSLAAMNSLLEFEGLGGQVQMIYIDPPYGVKFGSNFQPFVRRRDVKNASDEDMTREPEMVKAYRDTWELGLHSYLTYMRDRLLLARELLHDSGSIFVQISDENLHHARELLAEVFGPENFLVTIFIRKKGSQRGNEVRPINDYLLWCAKDRERNKRRFLFDSKMDAEDLADEFDYVELRGGEIKSISEFTAEGLHETMQSGGRLYIPEPLTSGGEYKTQLYPVKIGDRTFRPPPNNCWKFNEDGMNRIRAAGRIHVGTGQIRFKKYHTDFPFKSLSNLWADLAGATNKVYVVQTASKVLQRCILMTTDPGDLVFDPTCGSGTTAYVAEQWGRRWITCDTSRVPLALARQRLLTATFPYYKLKEPKFGPVGGFAYSRRKGLRGEESGGLVPHVTSTSVANDHEMAFEVLVDRPDELKDVVRVSGPFVVEATIAPSQSIGLHEAGHLAKPSGNVATHLDRMTEVLRQSKTLQLPGNRELRLGGIRRTVDAEYLHAEATEGDSKNRVAVVFGPEDGAISSDIVYEAAREAHFLKYDRLYFFGFAIQAKARELLEDSKKLRIPATYVAVTPDVAMSDLLKTSRASEIFSITGLPDIEVRKAKKKGPAGETLWEVELSGLDIFDPSTLDTESIEGQNVPAWMLDTDYDGMSFYATQMFFPKTAAWDNLQKSLGATFDESVWEHLAGTVSEAFALGSRKRIAVKVIDERGNELMRVKDVEA